VRMFTPTLTLTLTLTLLESREDGRLDEGRRGEVHTPHTCMQFLHRSGHASCLESSATHTKAASAAPLALGVLQANSGGGGGGCAHLTTSCFELSANHTKAGGMVLHNYTMQHTVCCGFAASVRDLCA